MRIIFIVVFSVVVVIWLFSSRPEPQAQLRELPPAQVITDTVKTINIQPVRTVTGKLQPSRRTGLTFELSGQIRRRQVEPGQYVAADTVLLQIDDGDFTDAVAETSASLQRERDAVERDRRLLSLLSDESEIQRREVARLEKLGRESLASQSRYDQVLQQLLKLQAEEARLQYSVDSANARIMIRQAELNKAERNLGRTKLVAPFDGVVNAVFFEVGDYAASGQIAIEVIQNVELDLYLEISGNTATHLGLGQVIAVDTGDITRQGRITALSIDPDPDTNTHGLRIRLAGDGLYPGQLAKARLPGENYHDVNVVPVSAVLHEEGAVFVHRVVDDRIVRTPVSLIQRFEDLHIIEGIEPDARVVIRDSTALADGQTVTVN